MKETTEYKFLSRVIDSLNTFKEPDQIGFHLFEAQKRDLVIAALKDIEHSQNHGFFRDRLSYCERERAFAETWFKENEPISGINNGNGILQDLFFENRNLHQRKMLHEITPIERRIVATVIQWLGTNVGMSFLSDCFKKAGYELTKIEPEKSL